MVQWLAVSPPLRRGGSVILCNWRHLSRALKSSLLKKLLYAGHPFFMGQNACAKPRHNSQWLFAFSSALPFGPYPFYCFPTGWGSRFALELLQPAGRPASKLFDDIGRVLVRALPRGDRVRLVLFSHDDVTGTTFLFRRHFAVRKMNFPEPQRSGQCLNCNLLHEASQA